MNKVLKILYGTALLAVIIALPLSISLAGPSGGVVIGGTASIVTEGDVTTITQSTDRGIIKWNSFDVGASQGVRFQQPSAGAVTVNRIMDNKASQIDGNITANGNVVLINPNGVVFGKGSKVDVGGLIATTSDLESDNDFMSGGAIKFKQPGDPNAAIVNNGSITAREAGLVGLVAPQVENNGTIKAKLGKVALASGDVHYIDMAGDGLISVAVSDDVLKQSVQNRGSIEADGGTILMTAAQARGLVDSVVENSGSLQSHTVDGKTGEIIVSGNTVKTGGTISVTGEAKDEKGGQVKILGQDIALDDTAQIDASGNAGGGKINIGGAYQGGPELPVASKVLVGAGAKIAANANDSGEGGDVVVWSDKTTIFHGNAQAKGGVSSGNGGAMEISGKQMLDFTGAVDLSAPSGHSGTLLLDPTNIVISSGANQSVTGTTLVKPNADNATSVLSVATLQNTLANASVIVQTRASGTQPGNITVDNALTWASGSTLTLNAANDIIINASIAGKNLSLESGHDVMVNATLSGSGLLSVKPIAGQTVGIGNGQAGILTLDDSELNRMTGWGTIAIGQAASGGAINAGAKTWTSNLVLSSGASAPIHINGNQSVGAHDLKFVTDSDPDIQASLSGSGVISFTPASASTSMGLAGETGTLNLSTSELDRIVYNGWNSVSFGNSSSQSLLSVGSYGNWKQRSLFFSGTGGINFIGEQDFNGNSVDIGAQNNVTIGANLKNIYDLILVQGNSSKTLGIGTAIGDMQIDQAELDRLKVSHSLMTAYSTSSYASLNIKDAAFGNYTVTAKNIGNVNLGGTITSAYTGTPGNTSMTFATTTTGSNGGDLTIQSGAIINPGAGRYVVYSRNPSQDSYNGFSRIQKSYDRSLNAYPVYSVAEQGNIFLYGAAPVITLNAVNASREYGENNPAFAYTATGLIDGDSITDALSSFGLATSATALSDVGNYAIVANPVVSGLRYRIASASGATLDITKATLNAVADSKTREYGDANPPLTIHYTGFKNNDDSFVLDNAPTVSTLADALTSVGTVPISIGGGADNNYNFTYTDGTLTINPALITVTVRPVSIRTKQNFSFKAFYHGLKFGQTSDDFISQPMFSTNAPDFLTPGLYSVLAYGASAKNYNFHYIPGTLKISTHARNRFHSQGADCSSNPMNCPSGKTAKSEEMENILSSLQEDKVRHPDAGIVIPGSSIRVTPDIAVFYGFNPHTL